MLFYGFAIAAAIDGIRRARAQGHAGCRQQGEQSAAVHHQFPFHPISDRHAEVDLVERLASLHV
jgi:hypothetical protein